MSYDALVLSAHPDDAESQMGGTLAKLSEKGQRILIVDLTDGEPTEFAEPGVRAKQANEAARILGVERISLGLQDRLFESGFSTSNDLQFTEVGGKPDTAHRIQIAPGNLVLFREAGKGQ